MRKAGSAKDAAGMLRRMSGQRLDVVTSIAIVKPGREEIVFWSEYGWVRFRKLTRDEIAAYVHSGKWKGKAAAVNVEEKPVLDWIEKKGGEQGAVIGLPLGRLKKEIKKLGA